MLPLLEVTAWQYTSYRGIPQRSPLSGYTEERNNYRLKVVQGF